MSPTPAHRGRLFAALALAASVLAVEVVGSLVTGSLSLLADAGHMASDVAALAIAILAVTIAGRPPSPSRTFGYLRLEVLAAAFNAVLLLAVAVWIAWEAVARWSDPHELSGGLMLAFAGVGLLANAVGLTLLHSGSKESLNVKGAYLEMWGDLLGSVGVIVAALVILLTGWTRADSLASIAVVLMIIPRAWSLLRETMSVLLESTPRNVDAQEIRGALVALDYVESVHDLHCWTITSGVVVASAHVVISEGRPSSPVDLGGIEAGLAQCLATRFGIEHATFQVEPRGYPCAGAHHD